MDQTTSDFASQAVTAFVIYCDERAMKASERERLAEDIYNESSASVDDTVATFPELEDRGTEE